MKKLVIGLCTGTMMIGGMTISAQPLKAQYLQEGFNQEEVGIRNNESSSGRVAKGVFKNMLRVADACFNQGVCEPVNNTQLVNYPGNSNSYEPGYSEQPGYSNQPGYSEQPGYSNQPVNYPGNPNSYEPVNISGRNLRLQDFISYIVPISIEGSRNDSILGIVTDLVNSNPILQISLKNSNNNNLLGYDAIFRQIPGLAGRGISFESVNYPGYYLRHRNSELELEPRQSSKQYKNDATFIINAPFVR